MNTTDLYQTKEPSVSKISVLQTAIEVNKKYEASLFKLIRKLEGDLYRIQMKRKALSTLTNRCKAYKNSDKDIELGCYVFGAPFFKDEDYFPGPSNLETNKVYKNKMLRFINLSSRGQWTIEEKMKIKKAIDKQLLIDKSGESIDWHNIAKEDVPEHTPDECYAMYNFVLHPNLRRGKWTESETNKLSEIAEKYNYHNWEKISEELNCQRSSLQCFIHFHTEVDFVNLGGAWTTDEEKLLIELVNKYKVGKHYVSWSKLCSHFDARTREEIYVKYNSINPNIKRGAFTEEEDTAIIAAVITYNGDFKAIPIEDIIPGRNLKQIKARYFNTLKDFDSPFPAWDTESDIKLLDLVQKHGRKWSLISQLMNFRNPSSCRHRFDALREFINKNPDQTIEQAPRKPKIPKRISVENIIHNLESKLKGSKKFFDKQAIVEYDDVDKKISEYFNQNNYSNNKTRGRNRASFDQKEVKIMKNIVDDILNIAGFKITPEKIKNNLSNIDLHDYTETEKLLMNYMIGNYDFLTDKDVTNDFLIPTTSKYRKPSTEEVSVFESWANREIKTYTNIKNKSIESSLSQKSTDLIYSKTIVPPNSSTLLGMRMIMITMNNLKSKNFHQSEEELILTSQAENALKFKRLFRNLFLWPSLLSYIEPNNLIQSSKITKIVEIKDCDATHSSNEESEKRGQKRKLHQ